MKFDPKHLAQVLAAGKGTSSNPCPPLPGPIGNPARPAAVLMPLIWEDGDWKFIFIKRTVQANDRHSGQIAFPGGRVENNDPSFQSAALRESQEELGIDPDHVEIYGKICPITTVTGYEIHPFLGSLPWPYPLTLSEDEVFKTLLIPLNWLADPENRTSKAWESRSQPGKEYPVIFYNEYQGEILWGATAQIVTDFLHLIQTPS